MIKEYKVRFYYPFSAQSFDDARSIHHNNLEDFLDSVRRVTDRVLKKPGRTDEHLIAEWVRDDCTGVQLCLNGVFPAKSSRKDIARRAAEHGVSLGLRYQWMLVCENEALVKRGQKNMFVWRGIPCEVTERESRILAWMYDKSEASVHELSRSCWGERYHVRHRSKINKALSLLGTKLCHNNPPIPILFSLRGDMVLKTESS